jgi:hypothetical protein
VAKATPEADRGADTLSPARNFTLTAAERVGAAIAGAPAYARRLRAIEDLEARLAQWLADGIEPNDKARRAFADELDHLNELIDRHNRYYPAERNLPCDPRSGAMLDHGRPWRPLRRATPESLRAHGAGAGAI